MLELDVRSCAQHSPFSFPLARTTNCECDYLRKEREHELRVTAEMLSWAQGQLAALANESTNSSIQTVLDAIQS